MVPWIAAQEQAAATAGFDANDWIAQTWAYDRHNVGDTPIDGKPVFGGDHIKALHSIKAKALLSRVSSIFTTRSRKGSRPQIGRASCRERVCT